MTIRTEGQPFAQILPAAELDAEIHRDESNYASRLRTRAAAEEKAAFEAERRSFRGFTAKMTPRQAAKMEAALLKQQGFSGQFARRHEFVEHAVASGASVEHHKGGRRLVLPSGSFYNEADITKTAMDYAEFLMQPPARNPRSGRRHRRNPSDDYLLRRVEMQPYTDGRRWRLETWDTGRTDWRGQSKIAYRLTDADGISILFEGDDFAGSPMHADDSDETLRSLLTFLTLRPGDTDPEFFEEYTPEQMDFAETDAEALSIYAQEDVGEPFIDLTPGREDDEDDED